MGRQLAVDGPVVLGVCAMAKKAHSEPMTQTLNRLRGFSVGRVLEFRVVYFEEAMILNKPVEEWPLCDALIAFFSSGFPLDKAIAYARLRKPFVFNDLDKQKWLFDRRKIYELLLGAGVPVPRHVVLNADEQNEVEESEDYLQINGVRISKPLVEKPISGEDHNIYLYYPRSQGGGSKRLFRKVQDRASQFYPEIHTTRVHDGNSYIYEELLQTEGTDVKVYAIGPEYAHAEARKSPVVDGKVRRNARGKEERYPVILDAEEKSIARKVVITFGQTICGFDLLRSNGRSYVCDVNGWSFVKDSRKFWSDSANLLRQYALEAISPSHLRAHPDGNQLVADAEEAVHAEGSQRAGKRHSALRAAEHHPSFFPTPVDAELLCVVALTRHGDRTPKEKLKFYTREPALLAMISEYGSSTVEELKIKNVRLMEEVTRRVCATVDRMRTERLLSLSAARAGKADADDDNMDDDFGKLLTVRQVLTSHPFRGINRKVQLKPTRWERPTGDDGAGGAPIDKPSSFADGPEPGAAPTEALFILKWGGELTALGEAQAEHLGTVFRKTLYPGEFGGVLRLHATYRHDLKIYASEEGRVQMTAAAFARGFLDLDGNLTPILASLVSKNEKVTQMLDETPDAGRSLMDLAKEHIHKVLELDAPISDDVATGARPAPFLLPPSPSALDARARPAARAPPHDAAAPSAEPFEAEPHHWAAAQRALAVPVTLTPAGGAPESPLGVLAPAPSNFSMLSAPALPHAPPHLAEVESDDAGGGGSLGLSHTRSPLVVAAPTASSLLVRSLRSMGNPKQALVRLRDLLDELLKELKVRAKAAALCADDVEQVVPARDDPTASAPGGSVVESYMQPVGSIARQDSAAGSAHGSGLRSSRSSVDGDDERAECDCESQLVPKNGETAHLQYCRWSKLRRDLYKPKKDSFDTTKVPDVYDNAMYDVVHNAHLGLGALTELYRTAHTLASYVVPQEYGIEKHDKVHIGLQVCSVLLRKIHHDLLSGTSPQQHEQERVHQLDSSHSTDVRSPQRHVRTRLYFTSESHIHSLFNVLRWGSDVSHMSGDTVSSIFSDEARAAFDDMELCYLTHVVFRVLHKKGAPLDERTSYCVQVLVSPGVNQDLRRGESRSARHELVAAAPMVLSSRDDLTLEEVDNFFQFFLGRETEYDRPDPHDPSAGDAETGKGRATVKNQFLSLAHGVDASLTPSASHTALPKFDQGGKALLNWSDLHGHDKRRSGSNGGSQHHRHSTRDARPTL
ncbi:hypothetical protein KFE25_008709 [Diacronema lutheri]|uniref:Inositol hexakisphosphate and diphosphoinositol-pentakisphosphate kinase n=1 Tax=Diacronema lutheri TaxID=2081491 RepID=A0A8J6CJS9_DIALT|nr:hypothetical protein KFE25_008709 [Diacronema lutheri]